jgi:hypothetical protein
MTKVIIPTNLIGTTLLDVASQLNAVANFIEPDGNGNTVYIANNQELFETILIESNIILIVDNGGDLENYIMYAELPYQIDSVSIYECEVPEGLQKRTMQVTDGTQILEVVKKLGQWCNANLTQTFSPDFTKIYVNTNPLGDWLTGQEMKIFVDGFNAKLLTRQEYNDL